MKSPGSPSGNRGILPSPPSTSVTSSNVTTRQSASRWRTSTSVSPAMSSSSASNTSLTRRSPDGKTIGPPFLAAPAGCSTPSNPLPPLPQPFQVDAEHQRAGDEGGGDQVGEAGDVGAGMVLEVAHHVRPDEAAEVAGGVDQ